MLSCGGLPPACLHAVSTRARRSVLSVLRQQMRSRTGSCHNHLQEPRTAHQLRMLCRCPPSLHRRSNLAASLRKHPITPCGTAIGRMSATLRHLPQTSRQRQGLCCNTPVQMGSQHLRASRRARQGSARARSRTSAAAAVLTTVKAAVMMRRHVSDPPARGRRFVPGAAIGVPQVVSQLRTSTAHLTEGPLTA